MQPPRLALVLSGGGARGAYEAGIIHYIRTALPAKVRKRRFDVHCGCSVGAINSCFTVATAHDHNLQGKEIKRLWESVKQENIYRRNLGALAGFLSRSSAGMISKLIKGSGKDTLHFPGFLDSAPFLPFIKKVIPWNSITKNIDAGLIKALSLVATNVHTGRMELFLQKHPETHYHGEHTIRLTTIRPEHARASAAIPVIFPTVLVNGIPYTDGGLRLNTPMSPAIHLGADAILVIGLNHRAAPGEPVPSLGERGEQAALGQVVGRVMNSIFLDKIQTDLEQVRRINRIIEWGETVYGNNFLTKINKMLKKNAVKGDIADRGLKKIRVKRIRPSLDIGDVFRQVFPKEKDLHFTAFEKLLIKILDVDPTSGVDFLSYIAFMPGYIKRLFDLGFEDARSHHQDLVEFLSA